MKEFSLYNPRHPKDGQILIGSWMSPQKENGQDFYFVRELDHVIVYAEKLHVYPPTSPKYGQQKLIADQLEMPLEGVRWYIDVIEKKFFKPPEEGGLPANKISYREEVAGERLHIMRSMNAGCKHPGYDLTNLSRSSHILSTSSQDFSASDPWLFQGGLMDFLKDVADQYENNTL